MDTGRSLHVDMQMLTTANGWPEHQAVTCKPLGWTLKLHAWTRASCISQDQASCHTSKAAAAQALAITHNQHTVSLPRGKVALLGHMSSGPCTQPEKATPVAASGRHRHIVRSIDADSRHKGDGRLAVCSEKAGPGSPMSFSLWTWPLIMLPSSIGRGAGCQATVWTQSSCPISTASCAALYVMPPTANMGCGAYL